MTSHISFMVILVGLIAIVNPLGALPIFLSMSGMMQSDDPAKATGAEDEIMTELRRLRDQIRAVLT